MRVLLRQHRPSPSLRTIDFVQLILLFLATVTTTTTIAVAAETADPLAAADDNDNDDGYQLTVAMPPIVLNIIAMDDDTDMAEFSTQLTLAMETHLEATLPETLAPSNIMSAADFRHVSLTGNVERVELGKEEEGEPPVVPTFTQIDTQEVIPEDTPLSLIQANLRGFAQFSFASLKAQEMAADRTTQVATSVELATMESLEGAEYDQLLALIGEDPLLTIAVKVQITVAGEVLNESNVPNDEDQAQLEGDSDNDEKGGFMRIMSSVGILVMMVMMLITLYRFIHNKREEHLKKQKQGKRSWKRPKSDHSESSYSQQSQSQRTSSAQSDQEAWMDAKAQQLATVQTRPVGSPARKSKRMLKGQQQRGQGGLYAITEEDSMNCSSNFEGSFRREGSYRNQETFLNEFGTREDFRRNDDAYRVDGEYEYDDPSGLLHLQNHPYSDDYVDGSSQSDSIQSNNSNHRYSDSYAGGRDEQSSPSGRLINFYRYNNEFNSPGSSVSVSQRSIGSYRYNGNGDYAPPPAGRQSFRSYRYAGGRDDPRHNSMHSSTSSFVSNGSESQSNDSYRYGGTLRRLASLANNDESFTRQAASRDDSESGSAIDSLNGSYRYNGAESSRRGSGAFNISATTRSSLLRLGSPFQGIRKAEPFHTSDMAMTSSTHDSTHTPSNPISPDNPRKQVRFRSYDSYRENSNRGLDESNSSRISASLRQEDAMRGSPAKPSRRYFEEELPIEDESIQLFGDLPSDKELEYAAVYEMELGEELSIAFEDIDLSGKRSFEPTPVNSSFV